ncbi:hypothetical protein N9L68_06850 [bacterium]|nr:hypothetical protein [bacterium]
MGGLGTSPSAQQTKPETKKTMKTQTTHDRHHYHRHHNHHHHHHRHHPNHHQPPWQQQRSPYSSESALVLADHQSHEEQIFTICHDRSERCVWDVAAANIEMQLMCSCVDVLVLSYKCAAMKLQSLVCAL